MVGFPLTAVGCRFRLAEKSSAGSRRGRSASRFALRLEAWQRVQMHVSRCDS